MLIHPLLNPYVASIEVVDNVQSTLSYNVYPGIYPVIGFQYEGQLERLTEDNKIVRLNRSGITGLLNNYRRFRAVSQLTKSILIRLYPWAIPVLFNEAANVFTDQSYSLLEVINNQLIQDVEEKILSVKEPHQMVNILQEFFIKLYLKSSKNRLPNQRIIQIAQKFTVSPTIASLETFARDCGYSKRNLERHFQTAIGLTPKRFMLIARFKKVIQMLQAGKKWEHIAEHLNYYDQSHFIKEFKQFTGTTPQQFIGIPS